MVLSRENNELGLPRRRRAATGLIMKRTAIAVFVVLIQSAAAASPTGSVAVPIQTPQQYAKTLSNALWRPAEWLCLRELWHRESRWDPKADNPRSSAYGIPQILGLDEKLTPFEQVRLGIRYVRHRYETPCAALRHHDRRGWY
jgi:hypothetical protein